MMQSFNFFDGLLLMFIYLKMTCQIDWSWWWVILVPVLSAIGVGIIIGVVKAITDSMKGGE